MGCNQSSENFDDLVARTHGKHAPTTYASPPVSKPTRILSGGKPDPKVLSKDLRRIYNANPYLKLFYNSNFDAALHDFSELRHMHDGGTSPSQVLFWMFSTDGVLLVDHLFPHGKFHGLDTNVPHRMTLEEYQRQIPWSAQTEVQLRPIVDPAFVFSHPISNVLHSLATILYSMLVAGCIKDRELSITINSHASETKAQIGSADLMELGFKPSFNTMKNKLKTTGKLQYVVNAENKKKTIDKTKLAKMPGTTFWQVLSCHGQIQTFFCHCQVLRWLASTLAVGKKCLNLAMLKQMQAQWPVWRVFQQGRRQRLKVQSYILI